MPEYLPGTARERIRDLLAERGMTISQLAERIGVDETTLGRFIRGDTRKISDEAIIALAGVFEVSTDFLLGVSDEPERINYDIGELGLSAKAARNLYTRKVNAEIVNRMLESPRFPALTQTIWQYFNDTMAVGVATRNQLLDMANKYMGGYAQENPELLSGLPEASADIRRAKINPHEMELERIRNAFMMMLRDIKKDMAESALARETVTKDIFSDVMQNAEKGGEAAPDRPIVTMEQVGSALADVTGAYPGQAEGFAELIQNFISGFTELASQGMEDERPDE